MKYFEELKKSMNYLGSKNNTIFIGQAVADPGTAMSNTLKEIDKNKLFETPVFEEMQMGISIGYALNGFIPICIFSRWNFLILASNQIINHLE
jgi:Pyruvate/2-oxoglutarate dehydrogenase complex, dehydrogenase (E1) component, eukaryotic type, beta subunit